MAFTIAGASKARKNDTAGVRQRRLLTLTGPASYATGGEAITPNSVGLGVIEHIPDFTLTDGTTYYLATLDRANLKLKVLGATGSAGTVTGNVIVGGGAAGTAIGITPDSDAGALTKAAAGVRTIPISTFIGGGVLTAGSGLAAAGGLTEVAAATNLSTFSGTVEVFGR
jgi:hypothetical protein